MCRNITQKQEITYDQDESGRLYIVKQQKMANNNLQTPRKGQTPAKKVDPNPIIEIDGDNAKHVRKVAELLEKRRLERLVKERVEAEERLERLRQLTEKRVKNEVEYLYDTESETEDMECGHGFYGGTADR